MKLDFHAETISDYGNITGAGLGNLLGAPALGPLELLIREAVQNSWDARIEGSDEPVRFKVENRVLDGEQLRNLSTACLHTVPQALDHLRNRTPLPVLFVSDRGTRGLSGPVRPTSDVEGPRDFVNFVYMIGETKPQNTQSGSVAGGSYGYGRSSFFRASRVKTVFVYTRTSIGEELESRFIGISWIGRYDTYTGRHWWGRERDGWVGPLTGWQADRLAASVGMPEFEDGTTGTTVMVVDPDYPATDSERSDEVPAARDVIVSSLLWNCWPQILAGGLDCQVIWDGESLDVSPERHRRLDGFVKAFNALRGQRETSQMLATYDIEIHRPQAHLGRLAIARRPMFRQFERFADPCAPVAPDVALRHVALMRNTLLVINYEKMPTEAREGEEYAGVFVTAREKDEVFARSEPPSHDRWVIERLDHPHEQRFVRVTFTRLKEKIAEFITPKSSEIFSSHTGSIAELADMLGQLLPGLEESARGRQPGTREGGGGARRRPQLRLGVPSREADNRGWLLITVPFDIEHLAYTTGTIIDLTLDVVTAGGREQGATDHRDRPRLVAWGASGEAGTPLDGSHASLTIGTNTQAVWVRIAQPVDCMVEIGLSPEGQHGVDDGTA